MFNLNYHIMKTTSLMPTFNKLKKMGYKIDYYKKSKSTSSSKWLIHCQMITMFIRAKHITEIEENERIITIHIIGSYLSFSKEFNSIILGTLNV